MNECADCGEKIGLGERHGCKRLRAVWFEKGQLSVKRKNKSGCCCIIDDDDNVISICGAHKNWLDDKFKKYKAEKRFSDGLDNLQIMGCY